MQVLYLVLVIAYPRRSCCSACPVLQRKKHFVCRQNAAQIVLPPETEQYSQTTDTFELMLDYLNNVESEYRGICRTLRTAATKHHVILRHLYRFLPEETDKLGCQAGVIQVTLSLTHDNS